jgi:hypothetical protein
MAVHWQFLCWIFSGFENASYKILEHFDCQFDLFFIKYYFIQINKLTNINKYYIKQLKTIGPDFSNSPSFIKFVLSLDRPVMACGLNEAFTLELRYDLVYAR